MEPLTIVLFSLVLILEVLHLWERSKLVDRLMAKNLTDYAVYQEKPKSGKMAIKSENEIQV